MRLWVAVCPPWAAALTLSPYMLMEFTFPQDDLDRSQALLSLMGSYWNNIWGNNEGGGANLVITYMDALQLLAKQTLQDTREVQDAVSRLKVPIFHEENWHLLVLKESELNDEQTSLPRYGGGETYGVGGWRYGVPVVRPTFNWPVDEELREAPLILNRITSASLTLTDGVDYILDLPRRAVSFRENPFKNPLVPTREIFQGNQVVDREAALWVFRGQFDFEYMYEQFAYILQLRLRSSQEFNNLVNAILDGLVRGTSQREIELGFSAITGTPLTLEPQETIEVVADDGENLLIVSDLTVYRFPNNADAVVSVGDTVKAGDPLVDTLQFFEFNRGQLSDELAAITTGRGFITEGFLSDITWVNEGVPLTASVDENGRTRIEWELGGFPGDTQEFWDRVHEEGTADGAMSLAQLLDPRTTKVGDPPPSVFPSTINPLQFLVANVLRNNAYLVKVRTGRFGERALGMEQARLFRKLVPPHTVMIILAELEFADEPVILDGPGLDETKPSYAEDAEVFLGMEISETIPVGLVTDRTVRLTQIAGRCQ